MRSETARGKVLAAIRAAGASGLTDDEAEDLVGLPHQSVSARRGELRKAGLVVDSGRQRTTKWGRDATVWVFAAEGRGPLFDRSK